jgi:hypothetical protein
LGISRSTFTNEAGQKPTKTSHEHLSSHDDCLVSKMKKKVVLRNVMRTKKKVNNIFDGIENELGHFK